MPVTCRDGWLWPRRLAGRRLPILLPYADVGPLAAGPRPYWPGCGAVGNGDEWRRADCRRGQSLSSGRPWAPSNCPAACIGRPRCTAQGSRREPSQRPPETEKESQTVRHGHFLSPPGR